MTIHRPGVTVAGIITGSARLCEQGRDRRWPDLANEYGFTDIDDNQPGNVSDLDALMAAQEVPEFWRALIPFS